MGDGSPGEIRPGPLPGSGGRSHERRGAGGGPRAGGIITGLSGSDKREILQKVVERMRLPEGFDRSILSQLLLARESAGSTAVGGGIAIPHPRHPVVLPVGRPTLTLCFLDQPVEFGAADQQPVDTLFVLVSPTIRAHLRMLARIACVLRDEPFRAVLKRRGWRQTRSCARSGGPKRRSIGVRSTKRESV